MQHQRLIFLFKRAMDKTILPDEHVELQNLLVDEDNRELVEQLFEKHWNAFETKNRWFDRSDGSAILERILPPTSSADAKYVNWRRHLHPWIRIAAVLVLVAVCSFYFLRSAKQRPHNQQSLYEAAQAYGIEPGGDKAVLTLGDGRVVVLDDVNSGLVAAVLGASILKSDSGTLRYDLSNEQTAAIVHNPIRIPKGGQYRLVLPDSSRVHLNSESFIKFPTRCS